MGDRMKQPVQSPPPCSSSAPSNQFVRIPSSSSAAVSAPVPLSPESLAIRNLKKRMNRLDINARTFLPSSGAPSAFDGRPVAAVASLTTPTTAPGSTLPTNSIDGNNSNSNNLEEAEDDDDNDEKVLLGTVFMAMAWLGKE
ncbi:hypothetical protein BGX29_011772 [Mortierella sp. GBA35]|nr:hypothetical protein BGX29_011772 [Mortierella sp. GBA35]